MHDIRFARHFDTCEETLGIKEIVFSTKTL
jgi:hypothetical protein